MKWMRNRFLLLPYVVLLTVLTVVGCTSKQDPSEELIVCGNHSCGELVMVTTDTSSDGYHYLNPRLSPDESKIVFSADWKAISDPRDPGTAAYVENRQLILYPNVVIPDPQPRAQLAPGPGETIGGELVVLRQRTLTFGGSSPFLSGLPNDDKAYPSWQDNTNVIFAVRPTNLGGRYRICRTDVTDPVLAPVEFLFMEPLDAFASPPFAQHLEPVLSPVRTATGEPTWLVFTRSSCLDPGDPETCGGLALWVLDMSTAAIDDGYGALAFPVTREYSRVETPNWSPDGRKIIFSGGLDVGGAGSGAGTELFTIDFDTTGLAAGTMALDNNLQRLTFTSRAEGDPIAGILNTAPVYANDGASVFFVSTRRAPAITLHDRNIWRVPADGSLDPEIYYFTRSDDVTPAVLPDGRIILSSALGFPTEMLNRLEEEAFQRLANADTLGLDEVQLRALAADERRQLEFFEGVMSHIYIYRP